MEMQQLKWFKYWQADNFYVVVKKEIALIDRKIVVI
jgi:hypothetical protein